MKIDGAEYHHRSSGSGEPVLLLHGFPMTSEAFWPQLDAPPKGVRVICPDHTGFGQSALRPNVTLESMASDALELLDALGLQSVVVGGVSMGGYVAMALLRLDPSRVRALVLADTQAPGDDAPAKARREETAQDLEANGMGNTVKAMLPRLLADDAKPYVRSRVEALMRAVNPAAAAAAARAMAGRDDSRDILARYGGPALIIVGEKDVITPPERAKQMAELLPRSKLVTIPSVGHLANLEAPQAFNTALGELVATLG
jgi:pimeloyl-ACP methyl ester carboxylesterase